MVVRFLYVALMTASASLCFAGSGNHWRMNFNDHVEAYFSAYDKCEEAMVRREMPDQDTLMALLEFDSEHTTRFLHAASFFARKQCERPALTELAYAVLSLESSDLTEEQKQTIDDVKVLVFSDMAVRYSELYKQIAPDVLLQLERLHYFKHPFDEAAVLMELESLSE